MAVKQKVYAYITHRRRLLVFSHPDSPEVGIQVPGGTVENGEEPVAAVLREAREETGLVDLTVAGFLGEETRSMNDFPDDFPPGEVHHRFFYHLVCGGEAPLTWRHHERFGLGEGVKPIAFDFFWVALPDLLPESIADLGVFIPQLLTILDD